MQQLRIAQISSQRENQTEKNTKKIVHPQNKTPANIKCETRILASSFKLWIVTSFLVTMPTDSQQLFPKCILEKEKVS